MSLVAVHLASVAVAVWTGLRVVDAVRTERAIEVAQQAVARFSTATREQYVHQAHTLLQADASHLAHDAEAAVLAEASLLGLEALDTLHPEDRARAHAAWEALSRGFLDDVAALGLAEGRCAATDACTTAIRSAHARLEREADAVESAARAMRTHLDALAARERARVEEALRTCGLALLALLVAAGAAAVRVTRGLEAAVVPDLATLTAVARRLGAGERAARVHPSIARTEEVRDVGHALDHMADAVERAERTAREAEARRIEAERLAALGELSAAVAHEVLNPLAAIVASTQDPVVRAEAAHAQRVVEGMLGFARGGRGEQATTLSVAGEAQAAADRLAVRCDARDVHVSVHADADPTVEAPQGAVRQVLDNLLRNALDAAPTGSRIEVRVVDDSLTVADEGPGIPDSVRARLYSPFATGRPDGTGE